MKMDDHNVVLHLVVVDFVHVDTAVAVAVAYFDVDGDDSCVACSGSDRTAGQNNEFRVATADKCSSFDMRSTVQQ